MRCDFARPVSSSAVCIPSESRIFPFHRTHLPIPECRTFIYNFLRTDFHIPEDCNIPDDNTLSVWVSTLSRLQGSMFRAEAMTIEADSDDDEASPPPYSNRNVDGGGVGGGGRDYSPRAPLSPLRQQQQQQPARPPKLSSFSFAQEEAENAYGFSASPSIPQQSINRPPSPR